MFPYTDKYPAPYNPDSGAGTNSAIYKIKTYAAASINELKTGLVSFSPLMVAIAIYENFDVDKDGFMLPAQGEIVGGHAICCVGYKDTQIKPNGCCLSFLGLRKPKKITSSTEGYFEFKNSWGTDWADKGYFKIRYSDLPKVFWEARSIVDD
jgi:C1A family cysteine protease